jgi:hypothetical protein
LTGDGKGRIELVGEVSDQPGIGNRLHFTLHFDKSQLGASIHELEKVTAGFQFVRPNPMSTSQQRPASQESEVNRRRRVETKR